MIEIALNPLGHVERGDPEVIWHQVEHKWPMTKERLAYNLCFMWAPRAPEGAEGPAIEIRFA